MPARLSSEGLLLDYRVPDYRYYPTALIPEGTRDWSQVRFLQACERLQIPHNRWPNFDSLILPAKGAHAYLKAPVFPVPSFDVLHDADTHWREKAENLFRQHCDAFLGKVAANIASDVAKGVLTKIERSKDKSSPVPLRYEWAARRYCYNEPYKDMATRECSPEKIRKVVAKIFRDTDIGSYRKRN